MAAGEAIKSCCIIDAPSKSWTGQVLSVKVHTALFLHLFAMSEIADLHGENDDFTVA